MDVKLWIAMVTFAVLILLSSSSPSLAASGTMKLTAWNGSSSSPDFVDSSSSLKVRASSTSVLAIDGESDYASWAPGQLIVDLTGISSSGAQFDFYVSSNGYSNRGSDDVLWVKGMDVAYLGGQLKQLTLSSNAMPGGEITIRIGSVGGRKIVQLPAPFYVPGGELYVKLYDGGDVIATSAKLVLLPALKVLPSEATAGQLIDIEGSAWPADGTVNVSMWYSGKLYATILEKADGRGWFKTSFRAPDLGKEAKTPDPAHTWPVIIEAFNGTDRSKAAAEGLMDSDSFTLVGRAFRYISTKTPDGNSLDDTGTPSNMGSNAIRLDSMVGGEVYINGTGFYSQGAVEIYWDYGSSGQKMVQPSESEINSTGYLKATFKVPEVTGGEHLATIYDGSWTWNFTLDIKTTLLISPQSFMPASMVSVKGFGFTPDDKVNIILYGMKADGQTETEMIAKDVKVDGVGSFNVKVRVPRDLFGGVHYIVASNSTSNCIAAYKIIVDPSISIKEKTVENGGTIHVNVHGWPVGKENSYIPCYGSSKTLGTDPRRITIAWDGMPTVINNMTVSNTTGSVDLELTVTGTPGIHYIGVYDDTGRLISTTTLEMAGVRVTTAEAMGNLTKDIENLKGEVSTLSSNVKDLQSKVERGYSDVRSDVRSLESSITKLAVDLSMLEDRISSIGSSLGYLNSSLAGLPGKTSKLSSQLSSLNSRISGVESRISGVESGYSNLYTFIEVVAVIEVVIVAILVALLIMVFRR